MSLDLIFHIVSRRKWQSLNKGGYYKPEIYSNEDEIECVTGNQLNSYLNKKFSGRKNLVILVIDKFRLVNKVRLDRENELVYIKKSVNIDAILDKIRIDADVDGKFNLEVSAE